MEVAGNTLLRHSIAEDSALTLSRPSSVHLEPFHHSKTQEQVGLQNIAFAAYCYARQLTKCQVQQWLALHMADFIQHSLGAWLL